MKTLDRIVLKVFLYGLPAIIVMAIAACNYDAQTIALQSSFIRLLYNFWGLVLGIWMLFSLYLSARLLSSAAFRETTLSKLAFMRERDEREVLLSGRATKTTFLTTMAVLICLLCLSVLRFSIYRVPPEQAINGKTGMVSLNLRLNLLDKEQGPALIPASGAAAISKSYVSFDGIPLSTTAILLILIVWQLLSYNYAVRRLTGRRS